MTNMPENAHFHSEDIWLCSECDLVIPKKTLVRGERAYCPHCRNKVAECSRYPGSVPLALAIAGLLLLLPACTLPLLRMQFLAKSTTHSIVSVITAFLEQSMWFPALLISISAVIIPFVYLSAAAFLLLSVKYKKSFVYTTNILYIFQCIKEWRMLEVYLMGIFIAMIKLNDIAHVRPDIGLVILAGLTLCQLFIAWTLKPYTLWQQIEASSQTDVGHAQVRCDD